MARIAIWIVCLIAGTTLGAAVFGMLGSVIGESQGTAEGEGFIGFLYGLWGGAALGLLFGGFLAYRVTAHSPKAT